MWWTIPRLAAGPLGGGVEDYAVQVIDDSAVGLNKSADTDELIAGETITYTFEATNTGDEPLDDVAITDTAFSGAGDLSDLVCDQPTSLVPGQTLTCTATYQVQQADVNAAFIHNQADVVGTGAFSGTGVDDQANALGSPRFRTRRAFTGDGWLRWRGQRAFGLSVELLVSGRSPPRRLAAARIAATRWRC